MVHMPYEDYSRIWYVAPIAFGPHEGGNLPILGLLLGGSAAVIHSFYNNLAEWTSEPRSATAYVRQATLFLTAYFYCARSKEVN